MFSPFLARTEEPLKEDALNIFLYREDKIRQRNSMSLCLPIPTFVKKVL
jgi:hypothetical protein